MIHYHGTPLSGETAPKHSFYRGRHAFVSYSAQQDLSIALHRCQTVALDNGAYSHWRSGSDYNPADVMEWAASIGHAIDFLVIPDKIDGTERENMILVHEFVKRNPCRGIPVFHMHEDDWYLKYLAANHSQTGIAIGSSGQYPTPGTESWWRRMDEIMKILCDDHGRPIVRIHGLRMLNPEIFRYLPLYSADSTNASRHGRSPKRWGYYPPVTAAAGANIIADRIEQYNSAFIYKGSPQCDFELDYSDHRP